MGVSVGMHICNDQVYDYHLSIGNEALNCGMEMACTIPDENQRTHTLSNKSCCENEFLNFENSQQLEPSNLSLELSETSFYTSNFSSNTQINLNVALRFLNHTYIPPDVESDIQLEIQQFLI
jgi:hypothetical protein